MRPLYVVCYDADESYMRHLAANFSNQKEQPFVLEAFWSIDQLSHRIQSGGHIDLFIGDYDQIIKDTNASDIRNQLRGCLKAKFSQIKISKSNYIFKYQSMERLKKQILALLPEDDIHFPIITLEEVHAIAVYSPSSLPSRSTLAKEIAKKKAGIYLGMEEFDSFYQELNNVDGMSKLLFYMKNRKVNISLHTELLAEKEEGFSMIHSPLSYMDLREMNKEDIEWYIKQMKLSKIYPFLVADIGCGALSDLTILDCFDRVLIPVAGKDEQDDIEAARLMAFYETINRTCRGVKDKCTEVPISYKDGTLVYTDCQLNQAIFAEVVDGKGTD